MHSVQVISIDNCPSSSNLEHYSDLMSFFLSKNLLALSGFLDHSASQKTNCETIERESSSKRTYPNLSIIHKLGLSEIVLCVNIKW